MYFCSALLLLSKILIISYLFCNLIILHKFAHTILRKLHQMRKALKMFLASIFMACVLLVLEEREQTSKNFSVSVMQELMGRPIRLKFSEMKDGESGDSKEEKEDISDTQSEAL